jgi:histidinol-phosphatase
MNALEPAGPDGLSDVELARALADRAETMALATFGSEVATRSKDDGTPVTDLDEAIERELYRFVALHRPRDGFLGEELGHIASGRRTWIVDPLDGTHAYLAGADTWGTQIALVDGDDIPAAVSVWPARSTRWWIGPDRHAYRSTAAGDSVGPLTVSDVANLDQVRWACNPSLEYIDERDAEARPGRWDLAALDGLRERGTYVPASDWTGHPALMVADGSLDICVQLAGGLWDHAAIAGIVQAAGGDTLAVAQPDIRLAAGVMAFSNAAIRSAYRQTLHP